MHRQAVVAHGGERAVCVCVCDPHRTAFHRETTHTQIEGTGLIQCYYYYSVHTHGRHPPAIIADRAPHAFTVEGDR